MSIRSIIVSHVEQIAREQSVKLPPLSDELALVDSGLDSLGFAILVARLEESLGFDPFAMSEDSDFPVTLADFIRLYEHAARSAETAA